MLSIVIFYSLIFVENAFSQNLIFVSLSNVHISRHIPLGIPIDSTPDDDLIIVRPQYIISYNPTINSVNWAGWNLNSTWFGKSGRYSGNFIADTTLPDSILRITHGDYTNSGYDRGHLVRSHERSANIEDNKSTFLMTNIIPQTPDLNRGVWLNFERFCEELALKHNKELYIYSGGVYKSNKTIGKGTRVPDSCYKIVVVLERGEGLECVSYNTIIYSVMMPNKQGIRNYHWSKYAVSVSHIENSTGYNFLKEVPEEIQGIIEQIIYRE
jgi:endonuclease G, mitochondrial